MIPGARSFDITVDGILIQFNGRIRLNGQDDLSLSPALFTLDLWNLPNEKILLISRGKEISVSHEGACIVSGIISDVYHRAVQNGDLTSVSISMGLNLWEAMTSITVPAETTVSDTVRAILSASGTGIVLLTGFQDDPESIRGQSFLGRTAECITTALSVIGYRPMLTPSGVMAVPPEGLPEAVRVSDKDLLDIPTFAAGSAPGRGSSANSVMILTCTVSGWRPGQTVEVETGNIHARGIVKIRSVDADTGEGNWKCEMLVEVLE